jgi:uncharacterized membrane protein
VPGYVDTVNFRRQAWPRELRYEEGAMSPALTIGLLWLGFAGSHLFLSSLPVRRAMIARIGELPFRGLYSLVAFAFFIPLVGTYFSHKHAGPALWTVPFGPGLRWGMYVGMGIAFVLLVASFVRPSPAAVVPGNPAPRGVYRITRHPLMMGLVIFGLLHLLPNGHAADVAFFGGFVLFPLVGAAHQDRRKLVTDAGKFRDFYEATPFLPFTGRSSLRGIRELLPTVAGLGIAVAVVVRHFHAAWFGG